MEQKIKFPRSQKVYLPGKLYPNIRVAMRKVEQVPSVSFEGEEKIATPNPEIYVYDTSGPFSDADMSIDLKKGLPRMREEWIVGRGDVEQLPKITSEYGQMRRDDKSLDHLRFEHIALPYRAKKGEAITQMAYAKRGIITPEMEYVACLLYTSYLWKRSLCFSQRPFLQIKKNRLLLYIRCISCIFATHKTT